MQRLTRSVLVFVLMIAGCVACGGAPAAPAGPQAPVLPRYDSIDALADAIKRGTLADGGTGRITGRFVEPSEAGGSAETRIEGPFRITEATTTAQFTVTFVENGGAPERVEVVALAGRCFFKLPPELLEDPGRPWFEIDLAAADPALQEAAASCTELPESIKATDDFRGLGDAAMIVEAVEERLGDVDTVRYTVRIDAQKAAAKASDPAISESYRRDLEAAAQAGAGSADFLVWLDARDRVHQFRTEIGQVGTANYFLAEYRIVEHGKPVDIGPPPADQIAQLPG